MKKMHAFLAFTAAVTISILGAGYRFTDSAHSIGLLTKDGGRVQHAAHFEGGKSRYVLIATATVLPPYRGDVRVSLENAPGMNYDIYNSEPVLDLGLHRQPSLKEGILYDLQPKDRLALWAVLRPCNAKVSDSFSKGEFAPAGQAEESCCPVPDGIPTGIVDHNQHLDSKGQTALAFYDTKTGSQVMRVPIIFDQKGTGHE